MSDNASTANKLIESLKKETRYCIVECSIFIEERASETIGRLLEIPWEESESFGYGRASLGFDQKIRLIQDLKGVEKKDKAKFQSFMAIRNKFAHLAKVDSFNMYFQIIKSSKERKKELKSWFPGLKWDSRDIEGLYKFAYFLLTLNLNRILVEIEIQYVFEKAKEQGRMEALEEFMNHISSNLKETEEGNLILENTIQKILNKNSG